MKEMWLFGQLDTLRRSEVEQKTEEDARLVAELLGRLEKNRLVTLEDTGGGDKGQH